MESLDGAGQICLKLILLNQPWVCNEKEYGLRSGVRWAMVRKRDRSMPYYSFPFPLAYATSYLRAKGFDATLRDSIALEETKQNALSFIKEGSFTIVVLDTSTASIYVDLAFAAAVKEQNPSSVVCLVGQHATALPEEVLRQSPADYALIGEYEKTLHELTVALDQGLPTHTIRGLAFRRGAETVNNGRNDLLDVNDLPPPFRDRLLVGKYNEPASRGFPNLPMMTSRGCSFRCTFCVEARLNYGPRTNFRYQSLDRVVSEIRSLVEDYGIKEIFFDDSFLTSRRSEEIAQSILDNRIKVMWSCWADRSSSMETLRLMRRAGCTGIKFGVETFDENIGAGSRKHVLPSTVKTLVSRAKHLGLLTHATYVFGLPGETPESIRHTIRSAFSLGTSSSQFSIATPLPGTEFYDQAKSNGWLTTDQWDAYDGQASCVLRYDRLSPSDIMRAMDQVRKRKILGLLIHPHLLAVYVFKLVRMMGIRRFLEDCGRKIRFLLRPQNS